MIYLIITFPYIYLGNLYYYKFYIEKKDKYGNY